MVKYLFIYLNQKVYHIFSKFGLFLKKFNYKNHKNRFFNYKIFNLESYLTKAKPALVENIDNYQGFLN